MLTIHNMAYQGIFPENVMDHASIPKELFSIQGLEFYGKVNLLKGGIVFSNLITTVSPKYAKEIQSSEFGCGLEGVLKERKKNLFGILNGVDYSIWNPVTDPHIAVNYSPEDLSGKMSCKQELINKYKLIGPKDAPLLGIVSHLVEQKGLDLIVEIIPALIDNGCLFVVLGSGDKQMEDKLLQLSQKYGKKLAVHIGFDNVLAHKIEAGSDIFLMPSKYEPCGLNQMYSLKYATIPIVHAAGGLDDTIQEFNFRDKTGNGFKFIKYTRNVFLDKVKRALRCYHKKNLWQQLMKNAMSSDYSWDRSARRYKDLYYSLAGKI